MFFSVPCCAEPKSLLRPLVFFSIFFLVGCGPSIRTEVLVPPESGDVSTLNPLAVISFGGKGGEAFRNEVEALMVTTEVRGKPYLRVVDRQRLKGIFDEIGFGGSGAVDQRTAVRAGQLIGAQGVVFGSVTSNGVSEERYTQKREECLDKGRKLFKSCKNVRKYTARCTKRTAHFAFTPQVISVQTGAIFVSKSFSEKAESSACDGEWSPADDKTSLLNKAKAATLEQFRKAIFPHLVEFKATVLSRDDSDRPKAAAQLIKDGAEWVKEGRFERGCSKWQESEELFPDGYAIYYNLGLCDEFYRGDLGAALANYRKADLLTSRPVKAINKALQRISLRTRYKSELSSTGKFSNADRDTIRFVQRTLNALGYDAGKVDGIWGLRTKTAVEAYQADQGLDINGKVDAFLVEHLENHG